MENQTNQNETITITRGQFDALVEKVNKLEQRGQGVVKPKKVTERVARLRFDEDKPVIWYGNVREKKDKDTGKLVAWMDIKLFAGLDIPPILKTVEYLYFLNDSNSVKVKILSKKMIEYRESQGVIRTINPDEAKIAGKNFQSQEIDAETVRREYTSEIEVLEGSHLGEKFTVIDNDALNK